MDALLVNGADIKVNNEVLGNALLLAVQRGHMKIVHLLVERGLGVDTKIARCDSPLQAAIRAGHFEIAQYLVCSGAQILPYVIKTATTDCPSDELREFILQLDRSSSHTTTDEQKNGKNEAAWSLSDLDWLFDTNRYTPSFPLISAAGNSNVELLETLLDQGMDIDRQLKVYPVDHGVERSTKVVPTFMTALLIAANNGHEKVVELLLSRNANLNVGAGISPLQIAAYRQHLSIVKLLLTHSECLDMEDQGGLFQSTLQAAVLSTNLETVKTILNHFVQFAKLYSTCYFCNERSTDMDPLNDAASTGSLEAVKLFLEFVPSDEKGPKAYHYSCSLLGNYTAYHQYGVSQKMHALRTAINSNHTAMIELITDNLARSWLKLVSETSGFIEEYKDLCRLVNFARAKQLSVFLDKIKPLGEENSSRYPSTICLWRHWTSQTQTL
jgi:ankyrin repeat protein